MQLIVAEKPSVARDLARVLGVPAGGARGWFEGPDRAITWCIGHLVELEEPVAYDTRWKAWRFDTLPMLPEQFKLRPTRSTSAQFRVVSTLLRDRRVTEVVNACDAGREGELIFRYLYQLARCRLPVRRLWISSLTDEAVKAGFAALRPGTLYDALADAARCRSEADWLVGLNATRALTLRRRTGRDSPLYSIGRVQTPTLAMLVRRERAIADFVPRDYFEVRAQMRTQSGEQFGALFSHLGRTRFERHQQAAEVAERDEGFGSAAQPDGPRVERLKAKVTKEPPPLLFDLTALQRTANRRFGLSASRTLSIAQALYEQHKVLTYPRTDSRHLTTDVARELPKLFEALARLDDYARFARALLDSPPRPGRRVVDDARVQDHHAIIPTGKPIHLDRLDRDERRIFDLVVRRFLGAFYPDAEFAVTEVVIRVGPGTAPAADAPPVKTKNDEPRGAIAELPPPPDRYLAKGRVRMVAGWQEVAGIDPAAARKAAEPNPDHKEEDDSEEPPTTLPRLREGEALDGDFGVLDKKTTPPPRHTEATLLAAMESAGRAISDEALRLAMKDTGLGTPATRASIIETLIDRGYITRDKKSLVPTPMGMDLVEALPVQSLTSAELTGAWEARLARIARGEERRDAFMADIRRFVADTVRTLAGSSPQIIKFEPIPVTGGDEDPNYPQPRQSAYPPPRQKRPKPAKGRSTNKAPSPIKAAPATKASGLADLTCPLCKQGKLVTGKRGWGCSRWREGCGFVVWFETAGKRLTERMLVELVTKGKTRKSSFRPDGNAPVEGRLVLDPPAPGGARFIAA